MSQNFAKRIDPENVVITSNNVPVLTTNDDLRRMQELLWLKAFEHNILLMGLNEPDARNTYGIEIR